MSIYNFLSWYMPLMNNNYSQLAAAAWMSLNIVRLVHGNEVKFENKVLKCYWVSVWLNVGNICAFLKYFDQYSSREEELVPEDGDISWSFTCTSVVTVVFLLWRLPGARNFNLFKNLCLGESLNVYLLLKSNESNLNFPATKFL